MCSLISVIFHKYQGLKYYVLTWHNILCYFLNYFMLIFIKGLKMKQLRNEEVLKMTNLLVNMSSRPLGIHKRNSESLLTCVTFQLHPNTPQALVWSFCPTLFEAPFLLIISSGQIPKSPFLSISSPIDSSGENTLSTYLSFELGKGRLLWSVYPYKSMLNCSDI